MPENAVADTPPQTIAKPEYIPPQETLKMKAGDKYRDALDKLAKEVVEPKAEEAAKDANSTATVETPKTEQVVEKESDTVESKIADKPASPLDAVTADKKPEEVKEETPDVLKEFEDEKTANWRKAREVMKRQSDEKKALEAKIAEFEKAPKAAPEEITKLSQERDRFKQELAEREELIKSVDVRLSEEYRTLAKKRDDTVRKISTRARSYGVDSDMLVSALALPESKFKTDQLKAVMAELEPDDKTAIRVLIEKFDEDNEFLMDFERNAPQKYEEIQAKREVALREQEEAAIKNMESEFVKIDESLPKDFVTLREVPEDITGADEWNKAIRESQATALRVLKPNGADFQESVKIARLGAHYPHLLGMFLKEHTELVDARKRLAEFDSGGPDFKGGGKPKTEEKLTPTQKYYKTLESLQSTSQDTI